MIVWDEHKYCGSGPHKVRTKVRFKSCNRKGNGNIERVSIERTSMHLTVRCFRC